MHPTPYVFSGERAKPPLSSRSLAIIRREALRLGAECRGEILVSEILAYLIEHEEAIYRELCDRARDPGRVVRRILPADLY